MEVASLKNEEWLCYRGGLFNGGGMVMLERWSVFNGGRMVMLQRRSVSWRGNGHVTEVVSLMEGEWSC